MEFQKEWCYHIETKLEQLRFYYCILTVWRNNYSISMSVLDFLADKIMQTMPCIVHIVINLGFLPMGYGEITSPQSSHLWIPDRLFHISAVSRGFKIKPDPAALGSCSVKYDMNPPFEVEVSWNFGNHSHPLQIL